MRLNQVVRLTRVSPRLINTSMNNYFYKVGFFEIDADLLYEEWLKISNKFNLFELTHEFTSKGHCPNYYRLEINQRDNSVESDNPVLIHGVGEEVHDSEHNSNNIVSDFHNTYSAEVSSKVVKYLESKYPTYKVTRIKYAALAPGAFLGLHTDKRDAPRFFLFIRVKQGCYMHIAGDKIPMNEPGALYRFNCQALHSPVNESDDYRLCMMFDVKKI